MISLDAIHSFPVEEYLLTRLAYAPDGTTIAVGHKHFRTYSAETGEARAEFGFPDFVGELRYSPDGRWIAAANVADNHPTSRGRISLFDAVTGKLRDTAEAPLPVETFAFDGGGRLFWNHPVPAAGSQPSAAIAGIQIESGAALPLVTLPHLQIRGLAARGDGFACFAREAQGNVQQVEGADLIFRKFRLLRLDGAGKASQDIDLGIGAGVHALSPDGRLLALELVDFKNNERHVSIVDVETGVEANLLSLEANTLPVFEFGLGSEYFLCMKEDAEANFNLLRIWRTSDLKLVGEAQVPLHYHAMASCLEHSVVAFLGGGKVEMFGLA